MPLKLITVNNTNAFTLIDETDIEFENVPDLEVSGKYQALGIDESEFINSYGPLQNLIVNGSRTQFTTKKIELDPNKSVELELQKSYDGSVNLIINPRNQPPLLINSGFAKVTSKTYELTDTTYNESSIDFNEQVSLFNVVNTDIPVLTFNGVVPNGTLLVGGYRYFFAYLDNEDNESDFIEESRLVTIYKGSGQTTTGGIHTQIKSDKAVSFTLTNLTASTKFPYIRVYYEYTDHSNTKSVYRLKTRFVIKDNKVDILHTGQEAQEIVNSESLASRYVLFKSVESITQLNNRLFFGNVVLNDSNYENLINFARAVKLEGQVDSQSVLPFVKKIHSTDILYSDPLDVYNKLGYWEYEFYAFGIVFILNNGELSPAFPVTGVSKSISSIFGPDLEFQELNGWKQVGSEYHNINGIVRMPSKPTSTSIISVKVTMPSTSSLEYQAIQNLVKGYFFVRTDRLITDRYIHCQGHQFNMIPQYRDMAIRTGDLNGIAYSVTNLEKLLGGTLLGPRNPLPNGDSTLEYYWGAFHSPASLSSINSDPNDILNFQYIPAPGYRVQASVLHITGNDTTPVIYSGTFPCYIDHRLISKKRFFVLSPDLVINQESVADRFLLGTTEELPIVVVNDSTNGSWISAQSRTRNKYQRPDVSSNKRNFNINVDRIYFSPVRNLSSKSIEISEQIILSNKNAQASLTSEFSGLLEGPLIFAVANSNKAGYCLFFYNSFPHYLGIRYKNNQSITNSTLVHTRISGTPPDSLQMILPKYYPTDSNNNNNFNTTEFSTAPLTDKLVYIPGYKYNSPVYTFYDNVLNRPYYSISKRYLLTQTPTNLYSGDCWTGSVFVKLFQGSSTESGGAYGVATNYEASQSVVGPFEAHSYMFIGLLCQSNYNPYSRLEEMPDGASTLRTFYPVQELNDSHSTYQEVEYFNNIGLSNHNSYSIYPLFDTTLPGFQKRFESRVYVSKQYVEGAIINGFRQVKGLSYRDYDIQYGKIVKLTNDGENIVMIQERAVSYLTSGRDIVVDNVVIGEYAILPEKQRVILPNIGTDFYDSVSGYSTIIGVDAKNNKIWTIGKSNRLISEDIRLLLRPFLLGETGKDLTKYGLSSKEYGFTLNNVITNYDPDLEQFYITFITDLSKNNILQNSYLPESISFIYNEKLDAFESITNLTPRWLGRLNGKLLSIPLVNITSRNYKLGLWEHLISLYYNKDNAQVKSQYCNFYNNQYPFIVEFVVNDNEHIQKILDNLKIIGNKAIPEELAYIMTGDDYQMIPSADYSKGILNNDSYIVYRQKIIPRTNRNIIISNYEYIEDVNYIICGKGYEKPVTLTKSAKIRDKVFKIRIIYQTPDNVIIKAVLTNYRYSYA